MTVRLNHLIVDARDRHASAAFLSRILGTGPPGRLGRFATVETANGVSLDFAEAGVVQSQHYAFLVDDEDFDSIYGRVRAEGVAYFADPRHERPDELNTRDGGRGFYFSDPDGHNLEVLTRPYGSGPSAR